MRFVSYERGKKKERRRNIWVRKNKCRNAKKERGVSCSVGMYGHWAIMQYANSISLFISFKSHFIDFVHRIRNSMLKYSIFLEYITTFFAESSTTKFKSLGHKHQHSWNYTHLIRSHPDPGAVLQKKINVLLCTYDVWYISLGTRQHKWSYKYDRSTFLSIVEHLLLSFSIHIIIIRHTGLPLTVAQFIVIQWKWIKNIMWWIQRLLVAY